MKAASCFLLALLAALTGGCPAKDAPQQGRKNAGRSSPAAGPLQVHQIKVDLQMPPRMKIKGLTDAAVTTRVKEMIGRTPALAMTANRGAGTHALWVQMGIGPDPDKLPGEGLVFVCAARLRAPDSMDGMVLQASVAAPLKQEGGHQKRAWAALDSVLGDMGYQAGLARAPVARLVKALAVKDPGRLEAAVEIVAVRRVKEAMGPLVKLLKHKEQRISDRAIGALVAIGDPGAVKHLTRLAKFSDTEQMAKVLDAIGALGGKEARQYLEFVASGHEDEDIRSMAKEALDRMTRSQKQKTRR